MFVLACRIQADIVVAMDSSGSVGRTNFAKEINFVKEIVRFANVDGGARLGVTMFSYTANIRFNLKVNTLYLTLTMTLTILFFNPLVI